MVKVSIVVISYNQGRFIEDTIKSVLNQSYENVEFLLIDGGSTDETMSIVDRYRNRFSLVIHEKDKGQTDAINKGFKHATGDLVGWVNSDDMLYPNCVKEIVQLSKSNQGGVIFYPQKIDYIGIKGERKGEYSLNIKNRDFLIKKSYDLIQQGSFYDAKTLKRVDYLDETLSYCMDLDLWLRLLKHGDIYQTRGESLAAMRIGDYTKTSRGAYFFAKEIRKTLLKEGANIFDASIRRTYWYQMKLLIKRIIKY